MAERITGWSLLNSKVVETASYALQSLADIAQRLAICHVAEQQGNKVRPSVESLAKLVCMAFFFAAKLTSVRPIKLATWEKRCTVPMEGVFFEATPAYVLLVKKSTFHFLCPDFGYFATVLKNLWDTCVLNQALKCHLSEL